VDPFVAEMKDLEARRISEEPFERKDLKTAVPIQELTAGHSFPLAMDSRFTAQAELGFAECSYRRVARHRRHGVTATTVGNDPTVISAGFLVPVFMSIVETESPR
jgi:hypothetical protein